MNLIICCTPLQVLIAEKIIDSHPEETFFGVMLFTTTNKKFDYYKKQFQDKCNIFFSKKIHHSRFKIIKDILHLKYIFCKKHFDKVFLANINELQIQILLSSIYFKELNTFDDGTANIIPNSIFYQTSPITTIRKISNILFGNKYNIDSLKSLSCCHYTLYSNIDNIITNTKLIHLKENDLYKNINQKEINILLGQPIYDSDTDNISLAIKTIKRFNIDLYLPHPREKYKINNVNYLDTELILEDYIRKNTTNKRYHIYTYFSTAALNIVNNPNIEVTALKIETSNSTYLACYELFEKLGVNIINIGE